MKLSISCLDNIKKSLSVNYAARRTKNRQRPLSSIFTHFGLNLLLVKLKPFKVSSRGAVGSALAWKKWIMSDFWGIAVIGLLKGPGLWGEWTREEECHAEPRDARHGSLGECSSPEDVLGTAASGTPPHNQTKSQCQSHTPPCSK